MVRTKARSKAGRHVSDPDRAWEASLPKRVIIRDNRAAGSTFGKEYQRVKGWRGRNL